MFLGWLYGWYCGLEVNCSDTGTGILYGRCLVLPDVVVWGEGVSGPFRCSGFWIVFGEGKEEGLGVNRG